MSGKGEVWLQLLDQLRAASAMRSRIRCGTCLEGLPQNGTSCRKVVGSLGDPAHSRDVCCEGLLKFGLTGPGCTSALVQMLSTGVLDVASVCLHLWCWSRPRQRTGHSVTSPCEGILFGGLLGGSCCADFFDGPRREEGAICAHFAGLMEQAVIVVPERFPHRCHQSVPRDLILSIWRHAVRAHALSFGVALYRNRWVCRFEVSQICRNLAWLMQPNALLPG